ncbi:MAG: gamma-glutamyltransferase family protein [Bacteroidetes bacterium]|nr:gamma-glutamyltransferase family protein [Bacteroidota bacterium]
MISSQALQQYPSESRRTVVVAGNGMVAASQHIAAQVGLDILKIGGNAVDAAIATAACLTVVEPTSNGIGSDAFAIVWHNNEIYGLNASGPAPMGISAEILAANGISEIPKLGWTPVTVPGTPAGWAALNRRFGKLPFEELMKPAVKYAIEGFGVTPVIAYYWERTAEIYSKERGNYPGLFDEWFRVFTKNGVTPKAGDIWKLSDHAKTLSRIGKTGSADFYTGELAAKITSASTENSGYLRSEDLRNYSPEWVSPVSVDYNGYTVWEIPPNGQGVIALMALRIAKEFDLENMTKNEIVHIQIEAMKAAFSDGLAYITDTEHMKVPLDYLLSDSYAKLRRSTISLQADEPKPVQLPQGGTVYLAAADSQGTMISFIQSNYMGFGSGIVVPGTGIALQNRGHTFSLDSSHANYLQPGKKTFHTIIPGFLSKAGEAVGPFGVMGGFMQPQGHMQVIMNMIDFAMNPQAALDAPRWQWTKGKKIVLENGFSTDNIEHLTDSGHEIEVHEKGSLFGRGQIIIKNQDNTLFGGTDPRADGAVCSW